MRILGHALHRVDAQTVVVSACRYKLGPMETIPEFLQSILGQLQAIWDLLHTILDICHTVLDRWEGIGTLYGLLVISSTELMPRSCHHPHQPSACNAEILPPQHPSAATNCEDRCDTSFTREDYNIY